MDGKELFRFLDLVIELEKDAKNLEEELKVSNEEKKNANLKGKTAAYKDAGQKLMKVLRELNSYDTSQMDWKAIKEAIEKKEKSK